MTEKTNATKRITLVIIIVAMVAVALILVFILSNNDSDVQIVLPSPSVSPETESTEESIKEDTLLSVRPENVKDVLSTVVRPSSYHRQLAIDIISGDNVSTTTVDIWVREGSRYAEIQENGDTRCVLIHNGSVTIWYDGKDDVHSFDENDHFSADDLLGIPTYEDVLDADENQIVSADHITDANGRSLLYVETESDNGAYRDRYWVSLDTGLLTEAMTLYSGETVYSMRETFMQQLPATDAEFDDIFLSPAA